MVEDVQQRLPQDSAVPNVAQGSQHGAPATSPEELVRQVLNEVTPDALFEELTEKWDKENRSKKAIRFVVAALFCVALLLVAYLSLFDAPHRVYRTAT
jgi:hypothetical protein